MQTTVDVFLAMLLLVYAAIHVLPFCSHRALQKIAFNRICVLGTFSMAAAVLGANLYMVYVWFRIWLYSAETWNGFGLIPLAVFVIPSFAIVLATIVRIRCTERSTVHP